nr:MAG TPA: hypothetical protein [Caudoviricetes sp.]DAS18418.1 MAG TPA: hypothetical protein [Caudoviricetes sp.]
MKNEIKNPRIVLEMDNITFFQWLQAIKDFGEKEGDNGKRE